MNPNSSDFEIVLNPVRGEMMHNCGMLGPQDASQSRKESSLFFLVITCIYVCMHVDTHVQVRGPFVIVDSLLLSYVLNGGETFHPAGHGMFTKL